MDDTAAAPSWVEGTDGRTPQYVERLGAPLGAWVFTVFLTSTLGLAYGYATTVLWGALTFVVAQGVATWVLLGTASSLRVDERVLRAGRARLPREHVGRVRVLDADTARRLRGVDADPRAYLCVRSWVPGAVLVEVTDPADPHPYWLVSTRR
ncbi:MAG TPA: DUF3093 domain-containing protein, partial [Candidatus Nanopelagicales bacterium]|nr:DUF3093 domain-containing protein [Candidatus Nanopelagicales bacterium]